MGQKVVLLLLFFISCEDKYAYEDNEFLEIYVKDFTYNSSSPFTYHSLTYKTGPRTRVSWTSIDSFSVRHQNRIITEPIINYSTYSKDDGSGKQMIYIDRTMIGKSLVVIGCISSEVCSFERFEVLR